MSNKVETQNYDPGGLTFVSHVEESMSEYPNIEIEVAGPAAMFTRPDTGATPISYPVPTYSAAKGMFDAVLRRTNIYIRPTLVEVCAPIRYERYVTNYGGPLRKPTQVKGNNNYQLIATILIDVHYRIYAEIKEKKRSGQRKLEYGAEFKKEFDRRIKSGQTFYTPCLGWKEFVPRYFGELQKETVADKAVNLVIPSLLQSIWERGKVRPTFKQNVVIKDGVMLYE